MALPNGAVTLSTDQINLYNEALDLNFQMFETQNTLLSQFVDVHKTGSGMTNPGSTLVFERHKPLPLGSLAPLNEDQDVVAVKLPDTDKREITVHEFGAAAVYTMRRLLFSIDNSGPNEIVVAQLGDHRNRFEDAKVLEVANASTNIVNINGTTASKSSTTLAAVTPASHLNSAALRRIRADFIAKNVAPNVGGTYAGVIHPTTSALLQGEVGEAGWRAVMNNQGLDRIATGSVGQYLGFTFFEYGNAPVLDGAGAAGADVFKSYFLGAEALADATVVPARATVSPQTDHLGRFFGAGWYAVKGYGAWNTDALTIVHSGAEDF